MGVVVLMLKNKGFLMKTIILKLVVLRFFLLKGRGRNSWTNIFRFLIRYDSVMIFDE